MSSGTAWPKIMTMLRMSSRTKASISCWNKVSTLYFSLRWISYRPDSKMVHHERSVSFKPRRKCVPFYYVQKREFDGQKTSNFKVCDVFNMGETRHFYYWRVKSREESKTLSCSHLRWPRYVVTSVFILMMAMHLASNQNIDSSFIYLCCNGGQDKLTMLLKRI